MTEEPNPKKTRMQKDPKGPRYEIRMAFPGEYHRSSTIIAKMKDVVEKLYDGTSQSTLKELLDELESERMPRFSIQPPFEVQLWNAHEDLYVAFVSNAGTGGCDRWTFFTSKGESDFEKWACSLETFFRRLSGTVKHAPKNLDDAKSHLKTGGKADFFYSWILQGMVVDAVNKRKIDSGHLVVQYPEENPFLSGIYRYSSSERKIWYDEAESQAICSSKFHGFTSVFSETSG